MADFDASRFVAYFIPACIYRDGPDTGVNSEGASTGGDSASIC